MDAPAQSVTPQATYPPSVGTVPSAEYSLSPIEVNALQILANSKGGVTIQASVMPEGFFAFQVPKDNTTFNVCLVGKKAISPTGKKYKVIHAYDGEQEDWEFPNWNQVYGFISHNFGALTQLTELICKGRGWCSGDASNLCTTNDIGTTPPKLGDKDSIQTSSWN